MGALPWPGARYANKPNARNDGAAGGRGSPIECVTVTVNTASPATSASAVAIPPSETTSQAGCPLGSAGRTGAGRAGRVPSRTGEVVLLVSGIGRC
jgi:hypothetical protein